MNKDPYKVSWFMYILEAAFDYYLSVMVTGAYLARLTTQIGISDALTGIIASLGAFASCFQVLAIFLFSNRRVKKPLSMLYPVARLGSLMLYAVPFLPASVRTKTVLFMGLLFMGQLLTNAINAPKINWFMSLVDDKKRGNFTANKEIVTLLGYMVFSLVMGNAVDRLTEAGREEESFLLCAAVVFTLTALHTLTLLISREKPPKEKDALPLGRLLRELVRDTRVLKVVLVSVLWTVATHVTMPFESTYRIKELGFSMTFISAVTMASSFVRILVSKPLGRYADRHSFTAMLNFCFVAALASFLEGDASFAVEKFVYRLQPGDAVIVRPNERHHCILNTHSVHKFLCLWFNTASELLFQDFLTYEYGENSHIVPDLQTKEKLLGIYATLKEAGLREDTYRQFFTTLELLDIFRKFLPSARHPHALPQLLTQILGDMDENFRSIRSLEQLCENYFISTSTLNRLFRRYLGTSPGLYLESKRLAHSRLLLKRGETVLDACLESGFPDCSNYIRLFKKHFGMTPGQYKNTQL